MQANRASIYINKLAAAQRQLDAAIRMMLAGEDELAIHTIAAAAYQILRDLKKHRGRREQSELLRAGIFAFAEDLARGRLKELPSDILESPLLAHTTKQVAEAISRGDVKTYADVDRYMRFTGDERQHWTAFNLPAGFLKHADRRPDSTLSLDQIDNDLLIGSAIASYVTIMGQGSSTPEMLVGCVFLGNADPEGWPPKLKEITRLPPGKRRRACLSLLRDIKRRGDVAIRQLCFS
jgi:hypothetical protein